jgi:hypothetical protein
MKHKTIPKCECGNDCCESGPTQKRISIGKIEILLLNWGKMIYADMCLDCMNDIETSREQHIACENYNYGYQRGYEEAFQRINDTPVW